MNFLTSLFGKRSKVAAAARSIPNQVREMGPPLRVTVGRVRQVRMYQAAQVSRLTTDWPITITSANAEILVSAIALRSRLRQLERDDDYFRNMLWILENNVIGNTGLMLRMKMKLASGDYDREGNLAVRLAWRRYMSRRYCTVMRNMSGVELQRLCVRALARDGVILLRKHWLFNNPFLYALEPIEVDRLDHWWNRPAVGTANEIQFGVEMDALHCPVAYHVLTRHPGDVFAWRAGPKYRERIPANEIIAIWTTERAGQNVGMPLWPSVANRLNHLNRYEEAELVAARLASAKGGWFEKQNEDGEYVGPEDQDGNKLTNTEPGQWEELPRGWTAKPNDPQHPTDAYPYFMKGQLRGAAAGSNLPYNAVASDLEGVNFSSIRAGLLEARDGFRYLQQLVKEKLMEEWFPDWLPYAILSGQIKLPASRIREIEESSHWQGRGWPWVDPLKDVQADIEAVNFGLDSRRNIIADGGRDIEDVFEEQEEDNKLQEQHGLTFTAPKAPAPAAGPGEPGEGNNKPQE